MRWLDLEPTVEDLFAVQVCRQEAAKLSPEQLIECLASMTYQLRVKDRVISQLLKKEASDAR